MWKKLFVVSIVILVLSIGASQAYNNSIYDNNTIIKIEVQGSIQLKGKNHVSVSGFNGLQATNWTVNVEGMERLVYKDDVTKTYEYDCSNLTLAVKSNGHDGYFGAYKSELGMGGILTFNYVDTHGDGADMSGLWLKEASGVLNGSIPSGTEFYINNLVITFQNTTIDTSGQSSKHITFYGSKDMPLRLVLGPNGQALVPQRTLDGQPLDGELKIIAFKGTVVEGGKIFYGNPTLTGKGMTIRTLEDPESGYFHTYGWSPPPSYWEIEVKMKSGHIDGPSYPFWRNGAFVGVVAMVVLNAIGFMTWMVRKK